VARLAVLAFYGRGNPCGCPLFGVNETLTSPPFFNFPYIKLSKPNPADSREKTLDIREDKEV